MIKFIYYLLIFLFLNLITISSHDISKLKLVLVIQSHGDSTPTTFCPTDPYKNSKYWSEGLGKLTNRGKERMYKSGEYIRKRYDGYLGTSPREVLIRSSAADRCLESAETALAAIYPPEGRWQWNKELGKIWQPFPIQTEPLPLDGMLNPNSKCPAADEELATILNSQAVNNYTNEQKGILKYVSDKTGLNITDIIIAEQVFNTFFIEKENNYSLPHWLNDSTYKNLKEISDMSFYFRCSTKSIQRLRTGLLSEEISKNIKEAIIPRENISNSETNSTFTKLYIYFTHDTQIAFLLNSLNVFNMKSPPFGSAIFIELYEINADHIIQIYYLNETQSETPYLLHLPNCVNYNNECHLEQFLHLFEELIPTSWKHECHNDENSLNSGTGPFIMLMPYVIGSILAFVTIALFLLCIYFKRKESSANYIQIPIE